MIQVRSDDPSVAPDLMALHALLSPEESAPELHIAGRIEIVQGEQERDEITDFPGAERGPLDAQLPHPLPHLGKVVPQRCAELVERPSLRDAPEVGPDLTAETVDRMTAGTALDAEHVGSGQSVLSRAVR